MRVPRRSPYVARSIGCEAAECGVSQLRVKANDSDLIES
jgi:hypothetical protein